MAYIKIDETNRIVAASGTHHCGYGEIQVEIPYEITIEHIHDYLYIDGDFVYEPLSKLGMEETPSQLDKIEAQVAYTAMMTDTLLEV